MIRSLLFAIAAVIGLAGCTPSASDGPVVLAASSLQAPLEQLAAEWTASGRPAPVLSFASSAALARQIESGAPADIYISADRQWIDYLAGQAQVEPDALRRIAANRLVLARNIDMTELSEAEALQLLASERWATGDPDSVPLGRFAREALERRGIWDEASPNLVSAASARAALVLVARGETRLGVLYASDVASNDLVEPVFAFPANDHSRIEYFATILPASAHPQAQGFLEFLASPNAAKVFAEHGFAKP